MSKTTYKCPNCQEENQDENKYCKNCGQKKQSIQLNFGSFIREFFNSAINLDSKFLQTATNLFIPARLSIEFCNGVRQKYYHPFRIYFVSILLLFFTFSVIDYAKPSVEKRENHIVNEEKVKPNSTEKGRFSKNRTRKKYGRKIVTSVRDREMANLSTYLAKIDDDVVQFASSLTDSTFMLYMDTLRNSLFIVYEDDSIYLRKIKAMQDGTLQRLFRSEVHLSVNEKYFEEVEKVIESKNLSLWTDRLFLKLILKQSRKNLWTIFYANLTWLFLAVVPLFALILKAIYIRRNIYYLEHYVFLLELFSFLNILICLFSIISAILLNITPLTILSFSIFFSLFSLFSFKKFYDQNWWKTILKFLLANFTFFIVALIGTLFFAIILSFLM